MATSSIRGVVRHLRRAALGHDEQSEDGQLLERFLTKRDEAAFEALVRRHGPMVLGVCRRLLRRSHDVEDAFQATFLVLVRKAARIRRRELLGNWLYGVAYRAALEARAQQAKVQTISDLPEPDWPNSAIIPSPFAKATARLKFWILSATSSSIIRDLPEFSRLAD